MSTGLPPLASRRAPVKVFGSSSARAGSTLTCAPSRSVSARLSGLDAVAMTRPAPSAAPGARDDDDGLALGHVRAGAQHVPGRRALQDDGEGLLVGDAVGHRPGQEVVRDDLLGVATPVQEADDALPAADWGADELRARRERQLLGGQVGVLDLVGVGEVDAGRGDVVQLLPRTGLRFGHVDDVQDLRPAEAGDLHCAHRPRLGPPGRLHRPAPQV
jgi:hypothetical protein